MYVIFIILFYVGIGLLAYWLIKKISQSSRNRSTGTANTAAPHPSPPVVHRTQRNNIQSSSTPQPVPAVTLSGGTVSSPTETEIMEYFANTRHHQKDNWFRFQYKKVGKEWRAYIIRTPSLNGKSGNCHSTHRYVDNDGNYWVCYDPKPTTLHDAEVISRAWADRFLEYTVTGVEANSQQW